jgi:hypothetical protein
MNFSMCVYIYIYIYICRHRFQYAPAVQLPGEALELGPLEVLVQNPLGKDLRDEAEGISVGEPPHRFRNLPAVQERHELLGEREEAGIDPEQVGRVADLLLSFVVVVPFFFVVSFVVGGCSALLLLLLVLWWHPLSAVVVVGSSSCCSVAWNGRILRVLRCGAATRGCYVSSGSAGPFIMAAAHDGAAVLVQIHAGGDCGEVC